MPEVIGGLLLALLTAACPAYGDGWSLDRLNPFTTTKQTRKNLMPGRSYQPESPSALEKFNEGTKKFFSGAAAGTKKFFTDAGNFLTGKKPEAKKPTRRYVSWIRRPEDPRYARQQKTKKSWFDALFRREEPKRVETMQEWVGLPRPK